MSRDINALRQDLQRQLRDLAARVGKQIQTLATDLAAVNAKTQRVNTSVGPLAVGVPEDVIITWPQPWPDIGYGVWVQLATGNAALGDVHATLKAGSKTETGCVVTVSSAVVVALVGVDVLGVRT